MFINPGIFAAGGTAVGWAGTSLFFTAAGQRVGSLAVSFIRLVMGLLLLTICVRLTGQWLAPATQHAWLWLGLSGLVGLFISDVCLFESFLWVGPRVSMLIMTLAPPFAATLSWLWLKESLSPWAIVGMVVVLGGIISVVIEKRIDETGQTHTHPVGGVLLALAAAATQGVAVVFSKYGMEVDGVAQIDLTPKTIQFGIAATQIRALVALGGYFVLYSLVGWAPRTVRAFKDAKGMGLMLCGAVMGPFIGVSLSMVAISRIPAGIASTIMQTSPILVIPFVMFVHKEHISRRAILGAIVACEGVAFLSILGMH
jgi:drug/metabolite transporter (DMT)-like permease